MTLEHILCAATAIGLLELAGCAMEVDGGDGGDDAELGDIEAGGTCQQDGTGSHPKIADRWFEAINDVSNIYQSPQTPIGPDAVRNSWFRWFHFKEWEGLQGEVDAFYNDPNGDVEGKVTGTYEFLGPDMDSDPCTRRYVQLTGLNVVDLYPEQPRLFRYDRGATMSWSDNRLTIMNGWWSNSDDGGTVFRLCRRENCPN
jgi:hypothetical protein